MNTIVNPYDWATLAVSFDQSEISLISIVIRFEYEQIISQR